MISIEVLGAFDFLEKEVKIGRLSYEKIRGEASYIFEYDEAFLKMFPGTVLSRDLGLYPGMQSVKKQIFSCFGDACPDRWGKALIDKREMQKAQRAGKPPRTFGDFDYMVRLDDRTRMGALRFIHDGRHIGIPQGSSAIPIVADLKEIIRESQAYEKAVQENNPIQESWIDNLWRQGSSLGGARPKANVIDGNEIYIAKIPSIKDTYDIALWEHFATVLAKRAGISVPETRLLKLATSGHHVLLSKRFDRNGNKRIHYASSLTLTGLKDGDGESSSKGYLDIANTIISDAGFANPEDNLRQLYRRVAFNIAVGNHDDHFRNHGFILTKNGWTLSPAFDLNPTNSMTQSLMISRTSNDSSLYELEKASDEYLISKNDARGIINEVKCAVSNWKQTAKDIGISDSEQQRFAIRLNCHSISRKP